MRRAQVFAPSDARVREVLVDGGLLNNVPVDVAKRAFDPEFVFAVKLSGLFALPRDADEPVVTESSRRTNANSGVDQTINSSARRERCIISVEAADRNSIT